MITCIKVYEGTISQQKRGAAAAVILIWIRGEKHSQIERRLNTEERVKSFTRIKDNDAISCFRWSSYILTQTQPHPKNPDSNGQFPAMNYLNLNQFLAYIHWKLSKKV